MRRILFVFLFISYAYASNECFKLYPIMGEIGSSSESKYIKENREKFMSYSLYNGNYIYNQQTELTINRYLALKALEILTKNNYRFNHEIDIIDNAFNKMDKKLKSISIDEALKKAFGSGANALIGLSTDLVGKEVSYKSYIGNVLTFILEYEPIKKQIIKALNIKEETYSIYQKAIIASIPIVLEWLETNKGIDKALWRTFPKDMFIKKLSTSFSTFVALPISVYEGILDTVRLGATTSAIFKLSKSKEEASIDLWASAFILDYINKYDSDIEKMRKEVETYTYGVFNGGVYFKNGQYQVGKVKTFWEIFFWYTVKNLNYYDINNAKWSVKAKLVKSARLALDLIEKYGNGGNFSIPICYKLNLNRENVGYKDIVKFDNPINGFNSLYYMPRIKKEYSSDRLIHFYFYNYGATPNLTNMKLDIDEKKSFYDRLYFKVELNSIKINSSNLKVYNQYFIDKKKISDVNNKHILFKISPSVTIKIKDINLNVFEIVTLQYKPFYLPYGYDTKINNEKMFAKKSFVSIYNRGLLDVNLNNKKFIPNLPVTGEQFIKTYYKYIKNISSIGVSGKNYKNLYMWDKCIENKKCGLNTLIPNRFDFLTRDQVIKFIFNNFNFKNFSKKRNRVLVAKFSLKNWTKEWKTLYEYGIINGNNKKMYKDKEITQLEMIAILGRLKGEKK